MSPRARWGGLALAAWLALAACSGSKPSPEDPGGPSAKRAEAPAAPADPLPAKPALEGPRAFSPPAPVVFESASGMKVWLLPRKELPIVSVTLAVPRGSASDPEGKAGLAHVTADMLDEGAGARSALEVSSALADLGASLGIGVRPDGSLVSLTSLKQNFDKAFAILGDVVARPRFEPREWKRVSELWRNALAKRSDDPASVASVVSTVTLYGRGTPYGHPPEGMPSGAAKIDLADVRAFYAGAFRPELATLVVVGDVTRAEVEKAIAGSLGNWKAKGKAAEPVPLSALTPSAERPRIVLVDRPDAPQAVVSVVRDGVRATDDEAPPLELVNTALGGSFTSRLNQNLREEKGWTYGVRSGFTETRGEGAFLVRAAVDLPHTGEAVTEILKELRVMAGEGPTEEELAKVRAQDRADLVQTYETVDGASRRLGSLAALGLPPTFDAEASRLRQSASRADLARLAREHVSPEKATIVIVGPASKIAPQLEAVKLGPFELRDPEGGVPEGASSAPPAKRDRTKTARPPGR